MNIAELASVADELREAVNADGVELRLTAIDARDHLVRFELDLADAGCADCVLPPAALQEMVATALQRRLPGDYLVVVDDPRLDTQPGAAVPAASTGSVVIVSPAGAVPPGDESPGPD